MIEDDAGPVKVKSRIRYDEHSNRIVFMVAFGEVVEVDNVKLCRMFGMRRDVFALTNSKPGKKIFVMPQPCNFNVNGTTMFVYSNIVVSSPVGNTFALLLRTIHLEIDDKMERCTRTTPQSTIFQYALRNLTSLKSNCVTCMGMTWCSTGGICYRPPFSKSWQRNVAEKNEKGRH